LRMSHVVGYFSHCIFNTKQLVDYFESADHYCGAVENDRDSFNRKNHCNPSTGLQRIYSAYQCVYSLVSKSKEKIRMRDDGVCFLVKNSGLYVARPVVLIRPEGEATVPVCTWVWPTAFEHPRYIFPQSPPRNSKDSIPTFE